MSAAAMERRQEQEEDERYIHGAEYHFPAGGGSSGFQYRALLSDYISFMYVYTKYIMRKIMIYLPLTVDFSE